MPVIHHVELILPNPHDPSAPWEVIENFKSWEKAVVFVRQNLGGDDSGRINLISRVNDLEKSWVVDIPNWDDPCGPWIFVKSFQTKREAVAFVREKYRTNVRGESLVLKVREIWMEEGPRDWSPRWEKEKGKRK